MPVVCCKHYAGIVIVAVLNCLIFSGFWENIFGYELY